MDQNIKAPPPSHELPHGVVASPLTSEELTELTAYHEAFMQHQLTMTEEIAAAKAGAPRMRELLEKQAAHAKTTAGGERSGEYVGAQRNLAWLDQLMAS